MAGIFSLAWKILRGAEVASRKMVTVGAGCDQPTSGKNRIKKKEQTTPKALESFIIRGPFAETKSILLDRISNSSSRRVRPYRDGHTETVIQRRSYLDDHT